MDTHPGMPTAIVLVPGHWLGAWAWDAVAAALRAHGHDVTAVTLPGLDPADPHRASRTLTDQVDALHSLVHPLAGADRSVVIVAHSGAGAPVSAVLDRDPNAVARVVYVDSGPSADGSAFDASLRPEQVELPLPPFAELRASLDGLSAQDLELFRARAVPEPAPVIREPLHLVNDARRDVPATIIACSYPATELMRMAHDGYPMMAETATLRDLELVDLPTGHWPMWSRPVDLAEAIAAATR